MLSKVVLEKLAKYLTVTEHFEEKEREKNLKIDSV